MVRFRLREGSRWRLLGGVLAAAVIIAAPDFAQAQGFIDFLLNHFQRSDQRPPDAPSVSSYAEPPPMAVAPERRDRVVGAGSGRYVAFCVRLCDGQHFPLDHNANATPVETCRAMCPTAKTKIFFGTEIDHAVARDGARYADLDNAFVYRDHLVANCTCNGRDPFGLSHIDFNDDPTLKPGDIVSTASGPMAFVGRRPGRAAEFTPVDPATLAAELAPRSTRVRVSERGTKPPAVQESGAVIEPEVEATGNLGD